MFSHLWLLIFQLSPERESRQRVCVHMGMCKLSKKVQTFFLKEAKEFDLKYLQIQKQLMSNFFVIFVFVIRFVRVYSCKECDYVAMILCRFHFAFFFFNSY